MLPPLRPRQYSISSSPLADPSSLKLTWSLITHAAPASLPGSRPARGLASHHLAGLRPGDTLRCLVRRGSPRLRTGADPDVPALLVCAGAGIAPFRALAEHRALTLRRRRLLVLSDPHHHHHPPPAPMVLYVGARSPAHALYAAELEAWQAEGGFSVRYAYSSRAGGADGEEGEEGEGVVVVAGAHRYVQDRVWADREELCRLWEEARARVYVCGGRGVCHGVREVARGMYREQAGKRCGAGTEEDVEAWWVEALRDRYVVEVF